jgi:hypothetical protein
MNQQEIFTKVVSHLRAQNAKSNDLDGCKYRSSTGLMCAVGCLIDDEFYSYRLEGLNLDATVVNIALTQSGINVDDTKIMKMLNALQFTHDNYPTDGWEDDFSNIAKKYNLFISPLNTEK